MGVLPFDDARIEGLVLRFNAVTGREGAVLPVPGGDASNGEVAVSLQDARGDLNCAEITQDIENMNDEQKDARAALFWIGRGDREPLEWEATKALARQLHEGLVSRYLPGQPEVGAGQTEGREKRLEYGVY